MLVLGFWVNMGVIGNHLTFLNYGYLGGMGKKMATGNSRTTKTSQLPQHRASVGSMCRNLGSIEGTWGIFATYSSYSKGWKRTLKLQCRVWRRGFSV